VRGQYAGYRKEADVARDSDVETFCALRLFIDSWRWAGVPWFLRSGKCMATTATEILVELKPAPQRLFADSKPKHGRANYLRFRLSPDAAIALATRVKTPGKEFVESSGSCSCARSWLGRRCPTSVCWATPCAAMGRCSRARTRWRRRGRWLILC